MSHKERSAIRIATTFGEKRQEVPDARTAFGFTNHKVQIGITLIKLDAIDRNLRKIVVISLKQNANFVTG